MPRTLFLHTDNTYLHIAGMCSLEERVLSTEQCMVQYGWTTTCWNHLVR
jgi:hypothetical protein